MVRPARDITVSLSEVATLAGGRPAESPAPRTVPTARPAIAAAPTPGRRWSLDVSTRVRALIKPAAGRPDPRPTCRACGEGPVSTVGSDERNGLRLTRGRCVKCRADWALQYDGSQLLAPW